MVTTAGLRADAPSAQRHASWGLSASAARGAPGPHATTLFALAWGALAITACTDEGPSNGDQPAADAMSAMDVRPMSGAGASTDTGDTGSPMPGSVEPPGGPEGTSNPSMTMATGSRQPANEGLEPAAMDEASTGASTPTMDPREDVNAPGPMQTAPGDPQAPSSTDTEADMEADMEGDMDGPVDPAWPTGAPEDYGLDMALLDDAAQSIQRATGNRYGMVVIRDGVLIYEKYWQGGPKDKHVIYSCTKSWGSTLIGMAVTQGLLSVEDEVSTWVPDPAPGVSADATLEHVLTQSAHTAGRMFRYNSGYLLNTAPEILMAAADMTAYDFWQRYLAGPLGLEMVWPACPKGGCAGTRYPEGFIQFGNQPPEAPNADLPMSSVRDQAKLGWLWANDGVWRGKRLIDSEYIEVASGGGVGPRRDYGYLWWIEGTDQFSAIGGVGNCYVNVMPSRKLVIAVLGDNAGLGRGGGWTDFRALVAALN
ncbi:MAG: serine hydrolase [Myxococcales bacterium]|nr:serine hydrolase [Myxococcales bacterium]